MGMGILAALAFAGTASSATSIPVNISMTLDGLTQPAGCCVDITTTSTATVVLPKLGRVAVRASLSICGSACQPNGLTIFAVEFKAPSGDMFVLVGTMDRGSLSNHSGSGTWTVGTGSGRFAEATGSGSWSAAATFVGPGSPQGTPTVLTFSLTGSITLRA
jgi:hypothetical protein